ncbi:SDR family oxidoreductase [Geodermatophilus africanus]|uniref:SDR family oxidoreductase n=1 Tax=Geodermatophilus africanus TaxID=1137993 RepID=UPI001FCD41C8|nr:SDR family oxidoreductase [Geodermatophilus africanus]
MPPGVVLVTGGSRGIGAATARAAAAAGWSVALTYRDDEAAAADVVTGIEAAGGTARAVRADVSVEDDVLAAFAAAEGLGPVTGLVANAGIVGERARVDELTAERVQRMLAVNVLGTVLCCREAVRRMSTRHGGSGGSVVLLSSAASRLGSPGEYVDYAASKGAVDTLGVGLAREVADEGVRVNVVRPGIIETEIHASGGQPDRVARVGPTVPMGRAGLPEEVAAAVLWLLGNDAAYCTGSLLDVAGGR